MLVILQSSDLGFFSFSFFFSHKLPGLSFFSLCFLGFKPFGLTTSSLFPWPLVLISLGLDAVIFWTSTQFYSKNLSIHFPIQVEDILCSGQDYIDEIFESNFSKEIESEDYFIVLESKYRELYLQIHRYKFTLVKHIQWFDFQT